MGLYPVTTTLHILINHYDGQPYLFWVNLGGGNALLNQEEARELLAEAGRHLAREEIDGNANTHLRAKVDVYQSEFEIKSVEMDEEYTFHDRPGVLESKDYALKMHYSNLRD